LGASGVAHRHDLTVGFGVSGEGIAVLQDTSPTRVRLIGNASWTLVAQDPGRTTLSSGSARTMDAVNVISGQYFAADLESETVQRRIAEALADEITIQLAAFFRKRAATTG
jgi:LPS-assembly lipoprotein